MLSEKMDRLTCMQSETRKLCRKSNGRIEIFGEKMKEKEVLVDRVFPLPVQANRAVGLCR